MAVSQISNLNLQKTELPLTFSYLKFDLAVSVPCDVEFRKFMTCNIPSAHVMPHKSGPTLKATQRGVVRLPLEPPTLSYRTPSTKKCPSNSSPLPKLSTT